MLSAAAEPGRGLSYGTAGNSATIHGSSGLYRRDNAGYFGRPASSGRGGIRSRYPSYGGYSPSSGSADEVQKETKYYYGGKYQGDIYTHLLFLPIPCGLHTVLRGKYFLNFIV